MALQTFEEKKAFVQNFNVFDDTFFEMVTKDKDAVEDILRIIFHEPELEIVELIPQSSVKNLYGRSVRLDALCRIGHDRYVNVEVQKSDRDNHLKRVRYNASCITANASDPGSNFENVRDVYIVYISRFDVFKKGRRVYHVGRALLDLSDVEAVNDGEKIIYVNGSSNVSADAEDEYVAELMAFFQNSNGLNEKFKNLSERVDELKNEESEVLAMCQLVEDYAREQKKTQAVEIALKLIAGGVLNDGQIAEATGLLVEEVRDLRPQKL